MRLEKKAGLTLITLLVALFAVTPAEAQSNRVSMNDLIPKMSSGQAYTERYTFAVDLDGGGHVGVNFTISNLGVRSGYGASEVRFNRPGVSTYRHAERESRRNWTTAEDRFALDIADTTVEADGENTFVISHRSDRLNLDLRFENSIPMWRPSTGEVRQGDDYYSFALTAPRATVTGKIQVDGGQWEEVTGTRSGYGDHVATNVAPYNLAKRFTRFRNYNDDLFVMWREIELTEDFGGGTVSWVIVGVDDRIIYEDSSPQVRFSQLNHDSETGYHVPHAAQVISKSGDRELRFMLRGEDVEKRDLLASYGRAARLIASRLSNPFQYNVRGDYALEVNMGESRVRRTGSSHVTVDFVNP